MKRMHALAMVVGLALLAAVGMAEPSGTPLEELVSKMADTPAEHQAVAVYFRGKAQEAIAAEYDALAKLHEAEAKAKPQGA